MLSSRRITVQALIKAAATRQSAVKTLGILAENLGTYGHYPAAKLLPENPGEAYRFFKKNRHALSTNELAMQPLLQRAKLLLAADAIHGAQKEFPGSTSFVGKHLDKIYDDAAARFGKNRKQLTVEDIHSHIAKSEAEGNPLLAPNIVGGDLATAINRMKLPPGEGFLLTENHFPSREVKFILRGMKPPERVPFERIDKEILEGAAGMNTPSFLDRYDRLTDILQLKESPMFERLRAAGHLGVEVAKK